MLVSYIISPSLFPYFWPLGICYKQSLQLPQSQRSASLVPDLTVPTLLIVGGFRGQCGAHREAMKRRTKSSQVIAIRFGLNFNYGFVSAIGFCSAYRALSGDCGGVNWWQSCVRFEAMVRANICRKAAANIAPYVYTIMLNLKFVI